MVKNTTGGTGTKSLARKHQTGGGSDSERGSSSVRGGVKRPEGVQPVEVATCKR